MPRRKRKRWTSFKKKVMHIATNLTGLKQSVWTHTQQVTSPADTQTFIDNHVAMSLYSGATGNYDHMQNLYTLARTINAGTNPNQKLVVSGWLVETQIVNQAATTAYIDMYYWRAKKDVPNTAFGSFAALWAESLADTDTIVLPGVTALTVDDYGVTPFQGIQLAKSVRIWKKTRVKLAPGGVTQIETRSGRNYYRNQSFDEDYTMGRGVTEGVFMVTYGIPTNVNVKATSVDLRVTSNYNYSWRLIQDSRALTSNQTR